MKWIIVYIQCINSLSQPMFPQFFFLLSKTFLYWAEIRSPEQKHSLYQTCNSAHTKVWIFLTLMCYFYLIWFEPLILLYDVLLSGSWPSALYIGLTLAFHLDSVCPAWTIACVPGLPLWSSPLDIVRWSKTTPVTWVLICLALNIPVCHLFDPCMCFDHVYD